MRRNPGDVIDVAILGAVGLGALWIAKQVQGNPIGAFFSGVGTAVHTGYVAQTTGQSPCLSYPCVVYQMHDDGFCWKDTVDSNGNLISAEGPQNILTCSGNFGATT